MTAVARGNGAFRKAVLVSAVFHAALFILIAVSPSLPGSSRKGLIRYIPLSLGGLPGGRSGGGSSSLTAPAPAPAEAKKPSLRDLTIPQKVEPEAPASKLRYPSEKSKRDPKSKKAKQAVLPEPAPASKPGQAGGQGPAGSGVRIGLGGPGEGSGSGYDSQIGLSSFPYTYYLQAITDRISANWFTSLVDPGVKGNFQTVVHFKILRNGQTTDVSVKESSGVESLDLSAMRAVQRSTPFPPLPSDYNQDYLGIFLIFEHSK
jgi:TonB family protein